MEHRADHQRGLVYSSEQGRMCPDCGKPIDQCTCQESEAPMTGDGIVRIGRETKGRKGKGVTLIKGLPLDRAPMEKLAKRLKRQCGAGGTVTEGAIEIQGEHRDRLVELLTKEGYGVKRVGG